MFSVRREELLKIALFQPQASNSIQAIEARKYAGVGVPKPSKNA